MEKVEQVAEEAVRLIHDNPHLSIKEAVEIAKALCEVDEA